MRRHLQRSTALTTAILGGTGLNLRADIDVDFTTGVGRELLTVTTTSGHDGTIGPRIPDHTGAYVRCPSGLLKGWRGIRVLSGIAGSPPAGWQVEGNGSPYWSLGSGWGMSWRDASGVPLSGVQWWGPQPATTEQTLNSCNPSAWTASSVTVALSGSAGPTPTVYSMTPPGGSSIQSFVTATLAASTTGTAFVIAKANGYNFVRLTNGGANNAAWFNLSTGTVGTVQAGGSAAAMTSLGNGWWLCQVTLAAAATLIRAVVNSADNEVAFTPNGTSGILIGYLGYRTRADFGFPIETTSAAVTVNAESVTFAAAQAGQWTALINGPALEQSFNAAAPPRFLSGGAGVTTILSQASTLTVGAWDNVATAANAAIMGTPTTSLGVRRVGGQLTFRANSTLNSPNMGSFSFATINAATTTVLGAAGYMPLRPIDRLRWWNRPLSDAEFLAA